MKFTNLFLALVIVILGTQFARAELWPEIDLFKLEITGCKDAKFGKIAALDDYLFITNAEGPYTDKIFVLKLSGYGLADLVAAKDLSQLKYITDIEASGQNPMYVYLTCESNGLLIFDFDPESRDLNLTGRYELLDYPLSISVRGSYAYITDANDGLHVLDISDAARPCKVGHYSPGNQASDVFLSDSYAFVTIRDLDVYSLRIVDAHDLHEVGRYDLGVIDGTSGIFVSGSYLFLGYNGPMLGDGEVLILDISDISNPIWVGNIPAYALYPTVTGKGSYVFVLDDCEFKVLGIFNKEIRKIGKCFTGCWNICVSEHHVYLSGSSGNHGGEIWGLDIASLPEPAPAAVTTTTWGELKTLFK